MHTVVKRNRYGDELVNCGTFWAISKPREDKENCNTVYHTGKEKYIKALWNKNFTIVYDTCPMTGCRVVHKNCSRENMV